MHILELNFEKRWRGGERQTIYGIQGFQKAGHQSTLLCRKGSPLARNAKDAGISLIECKNVFDLIINIFKIARLFDVLHCQTSNTLTYCLATRWHHKKPVVLSRRVSYVPAGYFSILKYRKTDKVIAISNQVKEILVSIGVLNVSVISDIAVPLETDKIRASHFFETYKCSGLKIIGTMAAFEPEKDPFTMIEAIKELYTLRKNFIFFHFGNGSMLAQAQALIETYGLEKIYITPGFMSNVHDFFPKLDVFAFSSVEEGLGSSVLDAFLYEIPVASTDGGGLKDLVTSLRGLISRIRDARQLASNIEILLTQESLTKKLVENAFDYVTKMHSMDYITSKYIIEFEKLLASRSLNPVKVRS